MMSKVQDFGFFLYITGVAHLHGYKVDPAGVASKKLSFNLVPPDPQMRMFSFYTDNETDKTRYS